MDCVDKLLRADIECLSAHADTLAALQQVLLSASTDPAWLAMEHAAYGFANAARTLTAFIRHQALALMSEPAASENRTARAAVMQAAASILIAAAGHPSARQWLEKSPEARELACALQNLPPHISEHVPLIHGGNALATITSNEKEAYSKADAGSVACDSDLIPALEWLHASPTTTEQEDIMKTCRLVNRTKKSVNSPLKYCAQQELTLDAAEVNSGCMFDGSHTSPGHDGNDSAALEPLHSPPPQATVVIEPFLEMYRRSRYALGSSSAARLKLPSLSQRPTAAKNYTVMAPLHPSIGTCVRPYYYGSQASTYCPEAKLSTQRCAEEYFNDRNIPHVAQPVQQNESEDVHNQTLVHAHFQGANRKSVEMQRCVDTIFQGPEIVKSAKPDMNPAEDQGQDTAGQNTVHVRMSFDQDTQSWQVAGLQASSADLLGAIASQLQCMPDSCKPTAQSCKCSLRPSDNPRVNNIIPSEARAASSSVVESGELKTLATRSVTVSDETANSTGAHQENLQVVLGRNKEQRTANLVDAERNQGTYIASKCTFGPALPQAQSDASTQFSPIHAINSVRRHLNKHSLANPTHEKFGASGAPSHEATMRQEAFGRTKLSLPPADMPIQAPSTLACMAVTEEIAPAPRKHCPSPTVSPTFVVPRPVQCQHPHLYNTKTTDPGSPICMQPRQLTRRTCHNDLCHTKPLPTAERQIEDKKCSPATGLGPRKGTSMSGLPCAGLCVAPIQASTGPQFKRPAPHNIPMATHTRSWNASSRLRSRSTGYLCARKESNRCNLLATHLWRSLSPAGVRDTKAATAMPPSPMDMYAHAKRFGPNKVSAHESLCSLDPYLASPGCAKPANPQRQSALPQSQYDKGAHEGQTWRSRRPLQSRILDHMENFPPSLCRTHLHRASPSRPGHTAHARLHKTCPTVRPKVDPAASMSEDSSSVSPVSLAATVWGCNALERALQQVENTLGRTYKKKCQQMPGLRSSQSSQHTLHSCLVVKKDKAANTKVKPAAMVQDATTRKVEESDMLSRERPQSHLKNVRGRVPAFPCLTRRRKMLRSGPHAVRMHQDNCQTDTGSRCMSEPVSSDSAGSASPWADEPGVYNLEAAAMRQAAQKIFRKQRQTCTQSFQSNPLGSLCHQPRSDVRQSRAHSRRQQSQPKENEVTGDSIPFRGLSVSRNVPVSHTHTSLARIRAAQWSRSQQRQADLEKLRRQ